jgi:phosphoserine aminotransferase
LPPLEDCETGRRDLVFTWNGTTTGVRIPDGGFIEARREGVTLCDATSAAFAQPLPWDKLDVTTFSFQKVLGGEAGVGVMVLSDHAIAVLEGAPPSRPMPKIFRLLDDEAKFSRPLLHGSPINTISMLTIADFNTALDWALSLGGFEALRARADSNARLVYDWLDSHKGLRPLCTHGPSRSNTAVCFAFRDLADRAQGLALVEAITSLLAEEEAAFDIAGYRDEPPGLRLWTGATVDKKDLEAVLPWIDWAYGKAQE